MRNRNAGFFAAVMGVALAAGGCVSRMRSSPSFDSAEAAADRRALAEATIDEWSTISKLAARGMIDKYGVPDEVHAGRLVWNRNGPWRRTVARNVTPAALVENGDLGVLIQTVDVPLSASQAAGIAAFDDRVEYNARSGELSARSDREDLNMLRLNLAHDVAVGRMSGTEARDAYAKTVELEAAGKTSPYLQSLWFSPVR